ncbi:MAG: M1 family aminopeptidase [Bacteroidota bacterium]
MKSLLTYVLLACFFLPGYAYSQSDHTPPEMKDLRYRESQQYKAMMRRTLDGVASEDRIDVKYYRLDIQITTSPQYLEGSVLMTAQNLVDNLTSITLDLMQAMTVDSVKVGGTLVSFTQHPSNFDIQLDRTYNHGEAMTMETFYQGHPGSSGFGSFEYSSHGGSATPWVWSLSEPFGAKDWWPCKDHPSDKADSADIIVTVSNQFRVGSNGKLISTQDNGDGTATYHWHEHYPISTYLISVTVTNFSTFSNWFHYTPTDSMEVLNYVLPEHLSSATSLLPNAVDGLRIYSNLFGLYPFIQEKYGHCEFGWGGGMEHQTMTSLGGFDESLVMHELAHQWFGDMITCRTWPDIWLNEGFATFCELLYEGVKYGQPYYSSGINSDMTSARSAVGTVSVSDSGATLFDWNLVYAKGAVVLHMLRHAIGDTSFFHGMRNYANNPALRFGTASTADFRGECEAASGQDLNYFFNEWIYGEKYPTYYKWSNIDTTTTGCSVAIHLAQTTGTSNPTFFTMPVDLKFIGTGWDSTITVLNIAASQDFTFDLPKVITLVQLDPQNGILKTVHDDDYTIGPDSLDFGDVIYSQQKTDTITVTNTGANTFNVSSVISDLPDYKITPTSAAIPSGSKKSFAIAFTPTAFGTRTGHLTFAINNFNIAFPTVIGITGHGTASSTLFSPSPDSLYVGDALMAKSRLDSITITNTGGDSLLIASAASDISCFTVTPSADTILPIQSKKFYVTFTPTSIGMQTGHITFIHNGTSSPNRVPVSGFGDSWRFFMYYNPSWNLLSVPCKLGNYQKDSVFPGGSSLAYTYLYPTGYVSQESLRNGVGYWYKFPIDKPITITGVPLILDTIKAVKGWNLIGSISNAIGVNQIYSDLPGTITSSFFGYRNGYVIVDSLQPGYGYWVKVSNSCNLILPSPTLLSSSAGKITISPSSEQPPAPPATIMQDIKNIPESYSLEQNYPNPFNPTTIIRYNLPEQTVVNLAIFNVLGQKIATLVNSAQNAGYQAVQFDASRLPSGIYVYRLTAGNFTQMRKMVLMR